MTAPTHREYRDRFYGILENLAVRLGGGRTLGDCDGRMFWPSRGVYFFFEPGEVRGTAYGDAPRIVRVGTHAVSSGSKTTLWQRLRQHQGYGGTAEGCAGNHRGSIFRHHVGLALIRSGRFAELEQAWKTPEPAAEMRAQEMPLEQLVSEYLGKMRVLWIEADDAAGSSSVRARVEANAIALLSEGVHAEPASPGWLGNRAADEAIRRSGLWNVKHVGRVFDPAFLDIFERLAVRTPVTASPRPSGGGGGAQATASLPRPGPLAGSVQQPILALISCTKKKAAVPSRASDLYAPSSFFRMAFALARRIAHSTFILSAKHRLVHPDEVVAPYEHTLATAGRAERREWALATYRQLCARAEYRDAKTVLWLAGDAYRSELMPFVAGDGKRCIIPMEGLAQGEQLAWLSRNTCVTADDLARTLPGNAGPAPEAPPRTSPVSHPTTRRLATSAPTSAEFEQALGALLARARRQSKSCVTVNAGELHRSVGGYPGPQQRMPVCCRVMRNTMRTNDRIIAAPPKGDGASLTVRYELG